MTIVIIIVSIGIPVFYSFKYDSMPTNEPIKPTHELVKILENKESFEVFKQFLLLEFSAESCFFYQEVEEYRSNAMNTRALTIYDKYVDESAPFCINVSYQARIEVKSRIEENDIDIDLFDRCQKEVLRLMINDSYRRFCFTPGYKALNLSDDLENKAE